MGGRRNLHGGDSSERLVAEQGTGKSGNKPATFRVALRCSWWLLIDGETTDRRDGGGGGEQRWEPAALHRLERLR